MQAWCLLPLTPPHLYSSREPTSIPDLTDVSRRVPDPPVTTSRPRFSKIAGGVTSRLCSSSTPPLILFKTVPLRQRQTRWLIVFVHGSYLIWLSRGERASRNGEKVRRIRSGGTDFVSGRCTEVSNHCGNNWLLHGLRLAEGIPPGRSTPRPEVAPLKTTRKIVPPLFIYSFFLELYLNSTYPR